MAGGIQTVVPCDFAGCDAPAIEGTHICERHKDILLAALEIDRARKARCEKTLAHQKGGLCLICGYDILICGPGTIARA